MVEKVWYCQRCHYTSQPITKEEKSKTCPTCGYQCKMMDFSPAKDFEADTKAIMEDYKREGRVLEPVNPDEKGREARIKETIEGVTNRKYEIIESKEKLIVRFKKTDEEKDNKLREELEKELLKFKPRIIFVNFF